MTIALSQFPGIDPVKDSSAALQAALNQKQPIVADCAANFVMGTDPTKSVFMPDGTDITFTPQGRFDMDATGFPALCALHANVVMRMTNIRYTGTIGVVTLPPQAGAWTDGPAKNYLLQNGLTPSFTGVGGTFWSGPSNTSALISIRGASNVQLLGGQIYVDPGVTADRFAYCGVGIDPAYVPGLPATTTTPLIAPNVTVSDFLMDGVCMGFVGSGSLVKMTRMTRRRYADIQDVNGANIGGVNTWSSPPHWVYNQGTPANPLRIEITDCMDEAVFCGAGRRTVASGYINSIKIELANGSFIDGFTSRCLDGGLGVLSNGSTVGGSVRNCSFLVDTSLLDVNGKPCSTGGLFFPSVHPYPYSDIDVSINNRVAGWPISTAIPSLVNVTARVRCGTSL